MKYLILSDIHFRNKFEGKKMKYLYSLVSDFDNIVLNGDLYEGRYIHADKFLNGKYKPFLDLLKSKNTIYIFGNHDPENHSKKVADYITPKQYSYLKLNIGSTAYHIEHGHTLGLGIDRIPDFAFKYLDTVSYIIQKYFDFLTHYLGSKWNNTIKNHRKIHELIKDFEILIVGHTHVKVLELENKFINGGYIKYGRGSYLVLSDTSPVTLHSVKY